MLLLVWLSAIGLIVPIAPIESPMRISAVAFSGEATGPFPLRAAAAARCCCFLRLSASLRAVRCASVSVALRVVRYFLNLLSRCSSELAAPPSAELAVPPSALPHLRSAGSGAAAKTTDG
jgi:hypothetical protein